MSRRTISATPGVIARTGICLLGTAAATLPLALTAEAKSDFKPIVIRGIPGTAPSAELRLAYQASFPNGSLESSVDKLDLGPMQPGDSGVAGSNPTFEPRPGELYVSITRPADLPPDVIPSAGPWATPVNFGPGSVSRIRATYIAPVGPIPGGGFAIGINAKTGGKDDLPTDTRIAVTVNVRPGFLVRFQVPFGAAQPTNVVLPQAAKDAMFSTTDPQPFTIELTMDRVAGKGRAQLTVADQVFPLEFDLADFRAHGGPAITAVGPGIAVNANAPGKTASVRFRDFRIYANVAD